MSNELVPTTQAVQQSAPTSEADAFMPVMDIARAVQRYNAVVTFTKDIMKEGKDFGKVPGTEENTLLKPGAEKLCSFFGLTPKFVVVTKIENWEPGEEFFFYHYRCDLYRGDRLIAGAEGSANSHESRYRWRWIQADALPPDLDKRKLVNRGGRISEFDFAINKAETSGKYGKPAEYWQRFKDAIANKTAARVQKQMRDKKEPAWEIDSTVYRVPNPDICDQVNTIVKIAQKRSMIAATLIACNASEYFTQDMEDLEIIDVSHSVVVDVPRQQTAPPKQQPRQTDEQTRESHGVGVDGMAHVASGHGTPVQQPNPQPAVEPQQFADPYVMQIKAQLADTKQKHGVFEALKQRAVKILGAEAAETFYRHALGRAGVQSHTEFKKLKQAQDCAIMMHEALNGFEKQMNEQSVPEEAPPADGDDWLPENLSAEAVK